jgi:fructose-1,6-bisphosphatase
VLRLRATRDVARRPEELLAELMVVLRLAAVVRPKMDDIRRQARKDTPIYSQDGVDVARHIVRRLAANDLVASNPLRHAADDGLVLDFFSSLLGGATLADLRAELAGERRRSLTELLEERYRHVLTANAAALGVSRIVLLRGGHQFCSLALADHGPNAVFVEALDDPTAAPDWGGPIGSWLTLVGGQDGARRVLASVMVQFNYTVSAIVTNATVVPPRTADFIVDQRGEFRCTARKSAVAPRFQLADHGRILAVDNVSALPLLLQRVYYRSLDEGSKLRTAGTVKDVTNVLAENGCLIRRATAAQAWLQLAPTIEGAEGEWLVLTPVGPLEGAGLDACLASGRLRDGDPVVFVGGCRINVRSVGAHLKPGMLERLVAALEACPASHACDEAEVALLALKLSEFALRDRHLAAHRRLERLVGQLVSRTLLPSLGSALASPTPDLDPVAALVAGGLAARLQAWPGTTAHGRRCLHRFESALRARSFADLAERSSIDPGSELALLIAENRAFIDETAVAVASAPRSAHAGDGVAVPWSAAERARRLEHSYLVPLGLTAADFGADPSSADGPRVPTLDDFLGLADRRGLIDRDVRGIITSLARAARELALEPASVLRDPRIGEQATKTLNARSDDSKILDRRAQAQIEDALRASGCVGVYGGEERDGLVLLEPTKRWAVILDEWDGSSVIPHRGAGAFASFHVFDVGQALAPPVAGDATDAARQDLAHRVFHGRTVSRDSVAVGWFAMGSQPTLTLAIKGDRGAHVFWLEDPIGRRGGSDGVYRYAQHLLATPGGRIMPGVRIAAGGSRNLWQPATVDYAICYLELQMSARLTYHGASMNDFQRSILGEQPFRGGARVAQGGFLYPAMHGRPRGFFSLLYEGAIFTLVLETMGFRTRAGSPRRDTAAAALTPRFDRMGAPLLDERGGYVTDLAYLDTWEFEDVNATVPLLALAGPVLDLIEYMFASPRYARLLRWVKRTLDVSERVAALTVNELVRRRELAHVGGAAADRARLPSYFIDVVEVMAPGELAGSDAELQAIAREVPVC